MSILADVRGKTIGATVALARRAIARVPDNWIRGGLPDPINGHEQGLVGAPVSRLDGPLKVAGEARFAAEVPLPGMLYAALAYSTIPKGRLVSLGASAAEAAPGVALVMTYRNAPRLKPIPYMMSSLRSAGNDDIPVMQDDLIHWNGQPIAVVLAETQEQADHAASLLQPVYEELPSVTAFAAARAAGVEPGSMLGEPFKTIIHDADTLFAVAPVKVDAVYSTPRYNHNALELHAVTVMWQGSELIVHDASQKVTHTGWSLARAFGLDEKQVRVLSPYVGGGFGGKSFWQHHVLAAAASRLADRPVRMALSREGVYRVVGGRTLTEQRVAIGAQPDGRFDALIHTGVVATSYHNNMPEPFIQPSRSQYAARAFRLELDVARIDMVANTFMRGPGEAVGTFALESAIDELADRLGMDPIELRLRNEPEKNPTSGLAFSARQVEQIFRDGAERFGWQHRSPRPGQHREDEWLVGMGVASGAYPYIRAPGGTARMTLTRDGHATIEIAAHELGMGTATVQTQVAAERLGLPLSQVTVKYGESTMPGRIMAVGSQQTAAVGAAIAAAQAGLVKEVLKLVGNDSPLARLSHDEVRGHCAGLARRDEPQRHETYASILSHAGREELTVEATAPLPLEFLHWSMHSHAAMFCEVKVSAATGEVRVSRFLGSFDCGRILNAKLAASQFRGGIIMGLGMALMEETQFDERNGRIMNPSLSEYHVPVHLDVPDIDVIWTDIPDPHSAMGAHGIGEIGITGTAAAVANAVYNATGIRVRNLPISLDKLL